MVRAGAGSRPHLASVLQKDRKNANIHTGLGFIWRIPVNLAAAAGQSSWHRRGGAIGDIRMGNRILGLAGGIIVTLATASAGLALTVPKVSGKYGIAVSTQCTANIATTSDGHITALNRMGGGAGEGVGTMTFQATPASTGHIALNYSWNSLQSVIINGSGNGVTTQTRTLSGRFKLTASQFTITPTTGTGASGPMSFGALGGNGVASTLYFTWTDFDSAAGTWCSHTLRATKQ